MRANAVLTWLRRQAVIDPKAMTISLAGGLAGPIVVACLQWAAATWAERIVFATTLIAR